MVKPHIKDINKREVNRMEFVPENLKKTTTPIVERVKQQYRYFCNACTGIAFFINEGEVLPRSAVCKACGKTLTNLKLQNCIKV